MFNLAIKWLDIGDRDTAFECLIKIQGIMAAFHDLDSNFSAYAKLAERAFITCAQPAPLAWIFQRYNRTVKWRAETGAKPSNRRQFLLALVSFYPFLFRCEASGTFPSMLNQPLQPQSHSWLTNPSSARNPA